MASINHSKVYEKGLKFYSETSSSSSSSDDIYNNDKRKVGLKKYIDTEEINDYSDSRWKFYKIDSSKIAFIAFVVVLFEFMFRNVIFGYELELLANIREEYFNSYIEEFFKLFILITDLKVIILMVLFLYLYADPLLAFKSVLITALGIVCVALLKVLYKTPRPYWINTQINVSICYLDYSGPSDHICIASMFFIYSIFIFLHKYVEKVNTLLFGTLLVSTFFTILTTAFALFYLGQTFLFESFMGIMCSTLLSIILLNIDGHIHKTIQYVCFDIYKSRRYKFMFLFCCIGLSICLILIYGFLLIDFSINPNYLDSECLKSKMFRYRLGLDYTFFDFTVISTLVGATFGCSFASSYIDGFLYQSTPIYKRFIRALLGVVFVILCNRLLIGIHSDNYLTEYLLFRTIPYFIIAYCVFGYYPCIWERLRLIEFEKSEESMDLRSDISVEDEVSDNVIHENEFESKNESSDTDSDLDIPKQNLNKRLSVPFKEKYLGVD